MGDSWDYYGEIVKHINELLHIEGAPFRVTGVFYKRVDGGGQ